MQSRSLSSAKRKRARNSKNFPYLPSAYNVSEARRILLTPIDLVLPNLSNAKISLPSIEKAKEIHN
jgi:hypothetical protein